MRYHEYSSLNLTDQQLAVFIVLLCIVGIIAFLLKKKREARQHAEYKAAAQSLRLIPLQGGDWDSIYGSPTLMPGEEKKVSDRYSGIFAGSAQGEFCVARCRVKTVSGEPLTFGERAESMFSSSSDHARRRYDPFVNPSHNRRMDGSAIRDEYETFEYKCVIFNICGLNMPNFRAEHDSIRDFREYGRSDASSPAAKFLSPAVLDSISVMPMTSIACDGKNLLFYSSYSGSFDVADFVKKSVFAAELVLSMR